MESYIRICIVHYICVDITSFMNKLLFHASKPSEIWDSIFYLDPPNALQMFFNNVLNKHVSNSSYFAHDIVWTTKEFVASESKALLCLTAVGFRSATTCLGHLLFCKGLYYLSLFTSFPLPPHHQKKGYEISSNLICDPRLLETRDLNGRSIVLH